MNTEVSKQIIYNTILSDLDEQSQFVQVFTEAFEEMILKDISELIQKGYLESEIITELRKRYKNVCEITIK